MAPISAGRGDDRPGHVRAERVGKAHVDDHALAEERARTCLGTVEELVGHDDVERLELLAQAADGARRDDLLHAERLHPPDVGAVVDLAGQDAVAAGVTRQEGDGHAVDVAQEVTVAGVAEGRFRA